MNQQAPVSSNGGLRRALSGVLFPAFFIAGDVLRGVLASLPLPLPDAPVEEAARYFDGSRTAVLVVGLCQILAAISLFVFAGCVVGVVRRARSEGGALPGAPWALTAAGGILAATFLLICGLLGMALVPVAAGGDLGLVGALRSLNFLTGGTFHVASLGIFVGAASFAARRAKALPGWICWLGIALAVPAILSLASLAWYPANFFILLGRLLAFVWCIAAGIALALGKRHQRGVVAGEGRHVLA